MIVVSLNKKKIEISVFENHFMLIILSTPCVHLMKFSGKNNSIELSMRSLVLLRNGSLFLVSRSNWNILYLFEVVAFFMMLAQYQLVNKLFLAHLMRIWRCGIKHSVVLSVLVYCI